MPRARKGPREKAFCSDIILLCAEHCSMASCILSTHPSYEKNPRVMRLTHTRLTASASGTSLLLVGLRLDPEMSQEQSRSEDESRVS